MPNVTGRRAQGHPGPIGPDDRDHLPYLTVRGRIQPERVDVPADVSGGWVLPGVALLIGVAVPQFTAAALIAAGVRPGLAAGFLAGLLLIAWIAVELLILRRYFFLQPVIAGIGAAEVLLAWRWHRSGRIVTGSRDQRP